MKSRLAFGCALVCLTAGCTTKRPAPERPKRTGNALTTVPTATRSLPSSAAAGGNCDASHAPTLGDAALKEFVARWRLAQKTHDLSAYSACYAEHFSGLVSHGTGAARVDRSAWLRNRAGSLALEPDLARANARIALGAGGARITFGSVLAQATGARLPELFVVSTLEGPKIARETQARAAPSELSEHTGTWLADERFAILSTAPDPAWSEGKPSFGGDHSATSAVAVNRLPKALRAWLGRPVRVLGENGLVCETRLQRFAIRAKISPDLPTAEVWDGCAEGQGPTPEAIAQEIWRLSGDDGRTLVAEFSTPCKGALLAVDPDEELPSIAAPEPAPAELGAAALTAFRLLPEYARVQRRFEAERPGQAGAWDDREARRSVSSLTLRGHPPLLFVSVEAGRGCADFSASLSALWEAHPDGANTSLTLLAVPDAEDDKLLTPRAIVELSRGASLLLGPDGVYEARSWLAPSTTPAGQVRYRQTLLTSVPFFGGPC